MNTSHFLILNSQFSILNSYINYPALRAPLQNLKGIFLRLFTFLLILNSQFSILNSFAQVDPPLRIELESAKDQQDYKCVSLANQGVAVFYQSAILSVDTAQWVFIHYDTNLVRTNIYKIKIPNLCQYVAADFSNEKLYLFLQKPAHKKDTLKNYLLEWNIATEDFQLFDLQNYKLPYLSSIKVADDYLFMIIHDQKARSIIYYNYKTDYKQTILFPDDEIISIESFGVEPVLKHTYFCMFLKNKQGSRAELFITDFLGNITTRAVLPFYPDLIYNSTRIAVVGKDSALLSGGYSNIKDKKTKGSYTGIYTMLFTKNKFTEINTYPFGALLTDHSGLNAKQYADPNLTMNMHVTPSNGHFFAITELFYPEYQYTTSSSYRSYRYYGYDPPTQVFAGFRFVNAYILEFDAQGLPVNDWVFPILNVLTQSLYNLADIYQDKEKNTLMFYAYQNEITSQYVNGKQVLEAQAALPVALMSKGDVLEYTSNLAMRNWYDNNFLVSGYQYIKNNQRGKGKRYVFFLSKMVCE